MIKITYTTNISKEYSDGLMRCNSKEELQKHLLGWKEVAADAIKAVKSPAFNWDEYQKGLKSEKKRVFSGEAWIDTYGAILIPEIIMRVALTAAHFMVPEGTAFIRMEEEGILTKGQRGFYHFHVKTAS